MPITVLYGPPGTGKSFVLATMLSLYNSDTACRESGWHAALKANPYYEGLILKLVPLTLREHEKAKVI